MKAGDTTFVKIGGMSIETTLIERVLPDLSSGQYESGFWAFSTKVPKVQYFISDEGIVYSNSKQFPDTYDISVGKVI